MREDSGAGTDGSRSAPAAALPEPVISRRRATRSLPFAVAVALLMIGSSWAAVGATTASSTAAAITPLTTSSLATGPSVTTTPSAKLPVDTGLPGQGPAGEPAAIPFSQLTGHALLHPPVSSLTNASNVPATAGAAS